MEQMARNVTMEDSGFLINRRCLLHDRDSKYCSSFGQVIEAGSVDSVNLIWPLLIVSFGPTFW